MGKSKRKTLPKNFEDLLEAGDLDALKDVFKTCDVNARGGLSKQTALAYTECPDELARWLIEQGADISAPDSYGNTPLSSRAGHWKGRIDILLELGADIHLGENQRGTPLHRAAAVGNVRTARLLLDHGARTDALNSYGQTPLVHALSRRGSCLQAKADMAEVLVAAQRQQAGPAPFPPEVKEVVERLGTDFEFIRETYNPDTVDAASAALDRLYALFGVPPVPRRICHDGKTPIIPKAEGWENQHQELWELLVPASGPAKTLQGEAIRVSGRLHNELEGNGGCNWDGHYRKMADAFLGYIRSGTPLSDSALSEAGAIVSELKKTQDGDTVRLCALAVEWVRLNPTPVELPPPPYRR